MGNDKMELLYWKGESVLGINKADNAFIDFTAVRKNQRFIEFMGKQAVKKTAHLMGIAYNMGAELGLDKKRIFNSIDNDLEEELVGKKGGETYKVEIAPSRISVKKEVAEGKWTPANEDTPAALVKKLFGPVGLFPKQVQEMKGRQQIEFFQNMFGSGEEGSKKMQKLEKEYDEKFADRRDINRDAKLLQGALEVEPLYQNRKASEKKFAKPISADKEKKIYDEKAKANSDYERYKTNLEILKVEHEEQLSKIEDLKKQLAAAEKQEKETGERIVKGDKWMADNKSIPKEYEVANKEWLNLSQTMADYEKWKGLLLKERQLTEKQEQSVTLTGELDILNEKILKTTNECLPKVKGLTAKVATGIDKKDKPEGVFFVVPGKTQEQPLHELSETEYADMWCNIWDEEGVQFIFIENLSSYGESMVNSLNQFVKNGGYVFYTLQNRAQKELTVSFKSKIE